MLLRGQPRRTIDVRDAHSQSAFDVASDASFHEHVSVFVLDQRKLPHEVVELELTTPDDAAFAISDMAVRGAPLLGVTGAFGLALQARSDPSDHGLVAAATSLKRTRPTAVNLAWAVDRLLRELLALSPDVRARAAWRAATRLANDDAAANEALGGHGLSLLRALHTSKGARQPLQILTHCNAGWLATVDWGTALAPIYRAHREGIPMHVWVDETRPRNQGASLTAFELREQGVPHTVIADNAGGHLMQRREVDAVFVGCDRVTARGDVANKIGTYLKALAAHASGVPFYVAMPLSTLDLNADDGLTDIPIEERSPREVTHVIGRTPEGTICEVQVVPDGTHARNPGFDVTPAKLITALITERGVVRATREGIASLGLDARMENPHG